MHAKWAPRGGKSISTAERQEFRRADWLKMDTQTTDMYSISSDTLPPVRGMHAKWAPRGGNLPPKEVNLSPLQNAQCLGELTG